MKFFEGFDWFERVIFTILLIINIGLLLLIIGGLFILFGGGA